MLIVALVLLLVLPGAAHAQIDVVFSGTQPVLRAKVGPLILSTRIGSRGIDVSTRRVGTTTSPAPTTSRNRTAASGPGSSAFVCASAFGRWFWRSHCSPRCGGSARPGASDS